MGAELGAVYLQRKTMKTILSSNNILKFRMVMLQHSFITNNVYGT